MTDGPCEARNPNAEAENEGWPGRVTLTENVN